jgi:hypothetical protein
MAGPHDWNPDRAMGLELEANDIENELERAEAEGATGEAAELGVRLGAALAELAEVEPWPETDPVHIHAPRAVDAA